MFSSFQIVPPRDTGKACVGEAVGDGVGWGVGNTRKSCSDFCTDGCSDFVSVGVSEGCTVGFPVVGDELGYAVGSSVVFFDGNADGFSVVGEEVGGEVGLLVVGRAVRFSVTGVCVGLRLIGIVDGSSDGTNPPQLTSKSLDANGAVSSALSMKNCCNVSGTSSIASFDPASRSIMISSLLSSLLFLTFLSFFNFRCCNEVVSDVPTTASDWYMHDVDK